MRWKHCYIAILLSTDYHWLYAIMIIIIIIMIMIMCKLLRSIQWSYNSMTCLQSKKKKNTEKKKRTKYFTHSFMWLFVIRILRCQRLNEISQNLHRATAQRKMSTKKKPNFMHICFQWFVILLFRMNRFGTQNKSKEKVQQRQKCEMYCYDDCF